MIYGIGTDILKTERIARGLSDDFIHKAFTGSEIAKADQYSVKADYYTGRFAAKEAVYKALSSCGIEFRPSDIEVLDDASGKPCVHILGRTEDALRKALKFYQIFLSISHETDYAAAFSVIASE